MREAVRNALLGAGKTRDGELITTLIDQFHYPRLGPGMMRECCRDILASRGHETVEGVNVERIRHRHGQVEAVYGRTGEGREVEFGADQFISTMPLRELVHALDPEPPDAVLQAADYLRYRDYLTVVLIVKRDKVFPDNWIYIHSPEVKMGRIRNYRNRSPRSAGSSRRRPICRPWAATGCTGTTLRVRVGISYGRFEELGTGNQSDKLMETNTHGKITKQLLVGLDAMEWSLVTRWAAEGKLPTFRRLIDQGTRAGLATTAEQLPDTVWACLYTGVNPAKLEKFFYVQYDPHTMGLRHVLDDEITRPPFWDRLSWGGVRVGVVDAPKFKLSRSLNGFQLANWGAHATKTARASAPSSLLGEVNARFGGHPVGDCDAVDARPHALAELRRNVIEGVRRHGRLFRWLMREQQWDVFFAGFSAPHCIGHHFWHSADPSHPRHHEAAAHGLAGAVEEVYRAIDYELSEMISMVGPETRVMVFAAHGMGPVYHASWNLPEILDLLGYGNKPAPPVTGISIYTSSLTCGADKHPAGKLPQAL